MSWHHTSMMIFFLWELFREATHSLKMCCNHENAESDIPQALKAKKKHVGLTTLLWLERCCVASKAKKNPLVISTCQFYKLYSMLCCLFSRQFQQRDQNPWKQQAGKNKSFFAHKKSSSVQTRTHSHKSTYEFGVFFFLWLGPWVVSCGWRGHVPSQRRAYTESAQSGPKASRPDWGGPLVGTGQWGGISTQLMFEWN